MKKLLITIVLISSQLIAIDAQTIVRKFQHIPSNGIEAIAPLDKIYEGSPNLSVLSGGKTMTKNSILVEIEASGKDLPRRILNGLIDAGEFDLGFSVMDRQLLFHNHYPSTIIIFKEKEFTIKLAYKIFVPKGMTDLMALPTESASR